MKAIQISFDEALLERLDATEEARRHGRSAVLRRAAADYLERRQRSEIAERYRQAYDPATGPEGGLDGWQEQGRWPDE